MDKQWVNMLMRPKHQQESEKQSQPPRATENICSTELEEEKNGIWIEIVIIKDTQSEWSPVLTKYYKHFT